MDINKQPGINFEAVFLKDLTFSRKPDIAQRPELDININAQSTISHEQDRMTIEMSCEVKDRADLYKINCSMIGLFSIIKGSENMELKKFAQHNAPALIFPYIRETIASVTAKAGIAAVLLPPININAVIYGEDRVPL